MEVELAASLCSYDVAVQSGDEGVEIVICVFELELEDSPRYFGHAHNGASSLVNVYTQGHNNWGLIYNMDLFQVGLLSRSYSSLRIPNRVRQDSSVQVSVPHTVPSRRLQGLHPSRRDEWDRNYPPHAQQKYRRDLVALSSLPTAVRQA